MFFFLKAYEEEIAFLESQHKEVGRALLEREKEFRVTVAENVKLKNALQEKVKTDRIVYEVLMTYCFIILECKSMVFIYDK